MDALIIITGGVALILVSYALVIGVAWLLGIHTDL